MQYVKIGIFTALIIEYAYQNLKYPMCYEIIEQNVDSVTKA